MAYLRLISPELPLEQKRNIAHELTRHALEALGLTADAREEISVIFEPYPLANYARGGQLLADGDLPDYRLEIVAPGLTREDKERLVMDLTEHLRHLLYLDENQLYRISILFVDLERSNIARGGHFLDQLRAA